MYVLGGVGGSLIELITGVVGASEPVVPVRLLRLHAGLET